MSGSFDDPPPRIVLDTNVCLDLFVFRDPAVAALRDALACGALIGATSQACRSEWERVLAYPVFRLDDAARTGLLADYDSAMRVFDDAHALVLPRCADPDDQKFLELAAACGARWLLSRDDALLTLAHRTRREGLFEILTPVEWTGLQGDRSPLPASDRHPGEGRDPGP